jgi:helicase
METVTGLTALEVVCDTPDMQDTYLGNRERAEMYRFARSHAEEFTTNMGETADFEGWLTAVKTARILQEWTEGTGAEELVDRFRIGPGDLESRVERAAWLLGAADAVADVVAADAALPFRDLRVRL